MAAKKGSQIDVAELRRFAEELLGVSTETGSRTADEAQRLLHELEVHKIELEMQNTELSKAREDVEALLEKYTDLYDFAPVGYFTLDRTGIIRSVNLTGAGLLGVVRSRLNGRRFEHFVVGAARAAFATLLEKVFRGPDEETCEIALLKEGGGQIFVQVGAVAAESGQECRVALIDVTKREQAEEALRKLEKAADEALQKVKQAAKVALREVAEAAEVALQEEKEATQVLRQEKESNDLALEKVKEAADLAHRKVEEAAEVALRKVEETAKALRKEKEATDVLRQEKEVADAATRTKSQFLANMSHELRTPMTGILGLLDLVLEGTLDAEQREFITTAHTSAHSLVWILNDILDLTKIEMGKFSMEEKPFSIRQCVKNTFNILLPAAMSKGLDFNSIVTADVPEILVGDQARVNQILTNLAGNAVKFTGKGRVEIPVTAGDRAPGRKREITFTVTDTGIGIPINKEDLLFRVFSQVDESHSRSYGGTGLGLAISKEIVERMGGTITFTSEEGKGSVFSCTIPLGEAASERDAILLSGETATAGKAPRPAEMRKPRLLIAEDDPVIRQVLGAMFQRAKYEIVFAENGQQAVEMWENGVSDLILMDVQMPIMNGFETTSAIREKERSRGGHIPIIAMTAHALKEDEERCLDAGMDAYISKPIDFQACLQLIVETFNNTLGIHGVNTSTLSDV